MNHQQEFILHIGGMTCVHCGRHIVSALEDVSGVEYAEVPNWKSGQAIVVADERVALDLLLAAVTEAGYTATIQK